MPQWLLLAYQVPRDPTANRVYVWRKLKRLGAVLLQDAVWVLPATEQTTEQFQWLAEEIKELGGHYTLWEGRLAMDGQAQSLAEQFTSRIDAHYGEILARLDRAQPDLAALARRYRQLRTQDFFRSPVGQRVEKALLKRQRPRQRQGDPEP